MRKLCYCLLTCDAEQKETIAKTLLEERLIACAKFAPIDAMYWWDGAIERANETLIIMETAEDLFADIEAAVAKIHSYDTFVLTQIPMTTINSDARAWMEGNLR